MIFTLPWSAPPLRSNKRLHHMAEHRIKRDIRHAGYVQAMHYMQRNPGAYPLPYLTEIVMTWTVPTKHRRDADAGQPTLKSWVDGITTGTTQNPGAGLIHDDSWIHVQRMWCEIDHKPGQPMSLKVEIRHVDL